MLHEFIEYLRIGDPDTCSDSFNWNRRVDKEMLCLCGQNRNRLDAGGTGADARDAAAGELDLTVGPVRRLDELAFEAVQARKIRLARGGEVTGGHDQKQAGETLASRGFHMVTRRRLVPFCGK